MNTKHRFFSLILFSLLIFVFCSMGVWGGQAPFVCGGLIYGIDGKPPAVTNIHLTEIGESYQKPLDSVKTDAQGRFEVKY